MLVAANPDARSLMSHAARAYQENGLSVQGHVNFIEANRPRGTAQSYWWAEGLKQAGVINAIAHETAEMIDRALRSRARQRMLSLTA